MHEMVTKCDQCKKEIPETAQRIIMLLGIVKQNGVAVDPKTKAVGTRPPIGSLLDEAISQKELCSAGCALTCFKRAMGGNGSEHDQQH